MYPPSNQIQSPDDEEEDQSEDGDNAKSKDSSIKQPGQEAFLSHYNQLFGQPQYLRALSQDAQNEKLSNFVCFGAVSTASDPMKISYERLIQESFNLSSPQLKAKKRKAEEVIEFHGGRGGSGRVVQSTGRKDRHSKVRTARGPRDRRVRLSPRTAIQFYDVQDRLGYDRPSKAIDWLIKEAKTAIDALDEQPPSETHSSPIPNHGGVLISECGMIDKDKNMNGENHISGFSLCVDGAAPSSSTELQAFLDQDFNLSSYQQGFCSALTATAQILETNSEIARLQKMLSWNSGNENSGNTCCGGGGGGGEEYYSLNSLPLRSQPISGNSHTFCQREPLQSSINNYSPINTYFPGFNFSNELSNITASATMKEDGKDKKLVFSRPSSTASFLYYED